MNNIFKNIVAVIAGLLIGSIVNMGIIMTSGSTKIKFALLIGVFFLIGGIASVLSLPSPTWFTIVDLAGAYLPMAFLGYKLAILKK